MQKYNKHMNRPRPRVSSSMVIVYATEKEAPKLGDRKMIKGVMHVRRYATTMHLGQRIQLMSRGKPVFEWVPEKDSSN